MEKISINPIEELLKAIEIVHGRTYAENMRSAVSRSINGVSLDSRIPGTPAYRLAEIEEWAKTIFWYKPNLYPPTAVEDILKDGVDRLQETNLDQLETETAIREELNIDNSVIDVVAAIKQLKEENKKLAKEIKRMKRKPRYRRY
jgi:hypothetical protein